MSTAEVDQLTSGASNRIIPILKTLRALIFFIQSLIFSLVILLLPRRPAAGAPKSQVKSWKRKSMLRREDEDTMRRRALAEDLKMGFETDDGEVRCRWSTSLFFGVKRNALFCRSWIPVSGELR